MLNLSHGNRSNIIRSSLLLWACLLMTACSSGRDTHISPQALFEMIEHDNRTDRIPIIIDARSQYEYNQGHVPGAIHIPFWSALARTDEIPTPVAGQFVVVYCAHGPRAGIAKWALSLNGYESILYLSGHMTAWSEAELPIEK